MHQYVELFKEISKDRKLWTNEVMEFLSIEGPIKEDLLEVQRWNAP